MVIPELPSYAMCPSIVHSSTWNGLSYPEYITELNLGEISGATSHSGRRSFITELAAKGISVRVLAELAGHQSIATTQRYIDINHDMLRNAVELV